MGLLDGIADIFLCFGGNFTLFSTVAGPICIPTSGVYVFPFLHILASHLLSLCLLDNGHPDRCEVDDTEHLVSCLLAIFMCSSVLFFCAKGRPSADYLHTARE